MAFADFFFLIDLKSFASLFQLTGICTEPHTSTQVEHMFLIFHHIHHFMRRVWIDFGGVGICVAQHIAGKFDGHGLHAHADAETGNIAFASIF